MLKSLAIENIVLIDKTQIDFSQGLCVLSGETGSGKSILLGALGLAIGFRGNLRLIGQDNNKASVVAEFDIVNNPACQNFLQNNDLIDSENKNSLRIRRTIQENSTNKIFVNDIAIGVNLLSQIGELLVEIHGQHDQRGLLDPGFHIEILDQFARNEELVNKISKIYSQLKFFDDEIEKNKIQKEQITREKEYLEYIVKELEDTQIKENEEEELIKKRDLLIAKEKILYFLNDFKSGILEANSQLVTAHRLLIRNQNIIDNFLSEKKSDFEKFNGQIDENNVALDELISYVDNLQNELNSGFDSKDEIEERLMNLRSLARKFNVTVNELNQVLTDAKIKLNTLEKGEEIAAEILLKRENFLKEYEVLAKELSTKRKEAGLNLSKKVEEELKFLKMENAKFKVEISEIDLTQIPYSVSGIDKVRFLAAINNDRFEDISKTASGGELSRFMLALKVALIGVKSVPVMIFDEIDTGIGGSTADAVGKRLKILSQNLQVLAVTHHPQIAAKSDSHFKIAKINDNGKVKTIVKKLDNEEKRAEIARMLSGEIITNEAIAAAESLLTSH